LRLLSQAAWIHRFAKQGFLKCGMDTSDGLAPTLEELARVNRVKIVIDNSALENGSDIFDSKLGTRASFGWGDWLVVSTVHPTHIDAVCKLSASVGTKVVVCGHVEEGDGVFVDHGNRTCRLGTLESERFVRDSWLSTGINSYINQLESMAI
jgi:thiamine-monophosphate kinase